MFLSQFGCGIKMIWSQFLQQFGKVGCGKWRLTKLPGSANDKGMRLNGVRLILPKCHCATLDTSNFHNVSFFIFERRLSLNPKGAFFLSLK